MHVLWANPWLKESLLCTKIAAASSVCCTTVQNVLSYVSALCQDWQWPFTFIIMVLVRHISGRDTSIIYLQHSHFRNIFCASKSIIPRTSHVLRVPQLESSNFNDFYLSKYSQVYTKVLSCKHFSWFSTLVQTEISLNRVHSRPWLYVSRLHLYYC